MAEISYPVVNTPVSETLWRVMARIWGNGIIDSGASPYRIVSKTDATNTIVIGRDTVTGFSEGILNGFVHRMDTDKGLVVGTAAATYEIGLVYDPAGHGTAAGPVSLQIWTAPGDYTGGKQRLVFYRIVRAAAQALSVAPLTSHKPVVSPTIQVSNEGDLAYLRPQDQLWGARALVYSTNQVFRANGSTWTEIFSKDPDVAAATAANVNNTLAKRSASGTIQGSTGTAGSDFVNIDYANGKYSQIGHTHSWSSITSKPSTFSPSAHNHNGDDITAGTVPYARIRGSEWAYDNTNTGSTWSSIVAKPSGEFARYPSALKYKRDVTDWRPDPQEVFTLLNPVQYYGKESGDYHIGIVADYLVGTSLEPLVQWENEENTEVGGFHYMLMGVAQQAGLMNHEDRIKALEKEIAELRAQNKGE